LNLKNPICLALDLKTPDQALNFFDQVKDLIGCVKIGPRLVNILSQEQILSISKSVPLFVDCKYFDIQNTVVESVRSAFDIGASFVTVHAMNGKGTLQALFVLEKELNQIRFFKILVVTVLTSWTEDELEFNSISKSIQDMVLDYSNKILQFGLTGIVCSVHELQLLKDSRFFQVTPGIRLAESNHNDQKRVSGPKEAIEKGSKMLVLGRPILQSSNPRETISLILNQIGVS